MLDHVSITVFEFAAAERFYDAISYLLSAIARSNRAMVVGTGRLPG
ncbi:hypothetical protein [Bradyrhizobium sp. AZCC 1693]